MTPAKYGINAYQGDALELDIPMLKPGLTANSRIPITVAEATAYRNKYTLIRMQVRQDRASPVLVSATKADGELFIDPNFVLPDGSPQPAFSIRIDSSKLQVAIDAQYDIEFDFQGSLGPYTALAGSFSLSEEISHDGP